MKISYISMKVSFTKEDPPFKEVDLTNEEDDNEEAQQDECNTSLERRQFKGGEDSPHSFYIKFIH
jgi:hypothetical protein